VPEAEPLEVEPVDEEEFSDFEIVEEDVERSAGPRRTRRKRRRRERRNLPTPIYMQDQDDSPNIFSGLYTAQKLLGLALMIWGVLQCFGSMILGAKAPPMMFGGLVCGGVLLLTGIYLFLFGD
jgi:hypothetical protein